MFVHENIGTFDELECETLPTGRTYTSPDGKKYPSITTVLGSLNNNWVHEWRKRVGEKEANRIGREAALNGTIVHQFAEDILNNKTIDYTKVMPDKVQKISALQKAFKHIDIVYAQEVALYSDFLKLAGRCDCIAKYKGRRSIIDFKTSRRHKSKADIDNYFIQACAYAIMFEERTGIPVPNLVIIMVVAGDSEPLVFTSQRDLWYNRLKESIDSYYKLKNR